MAAYAFGTKIEADKFASAKNKKVTSKYLWIVKKLDSGYVVMKRPSGTKASAIKNIKIN